MDEGEPAARSSAPPAVMQWTNRRRMLPDFADARLLFAVRRDGIRDDTLAWHL